MSYRQDVIDALNHKQTPLTPWAFEITSEFERAYKEKYPCQDVELDLGSHIMFGRYKKMEFVEERLYEDVFGVRWQLGKDGGDIGIPVNTVVDEDTVEAYVFPPIDEPLLEQGLQAMREDTQRFRMFRMTYSLYERAWSMMGMQELLMNMAMDEPCAMRLFERVFEYEMRLLERILDEDFEGVYFGDDWGAQTGLIMGPDCWRKYIKPFMKEMFAKVKSKGKYVLLHCCGNIEELFPELIEIGLDAYNTVQPEIYNLEKIKREYGRDLTFWGAISNQQFLPKSTPEEVFKKSVETIHILGKGGGYLFSPTHALTPDIPPENIRAMLKAVKSVQW